MERSSIIQSGVASTLVATYTTTANTQSSSGFDCSQYDRINVYITSGSRTSSGIISVTVDYSDDSGTTWHPLYYLSSGTTTAYTYQINADGNWYFSFPTAGDFARVRVAWVSGTSIAITKCTVEVKS
jgi:hypothetical protein